ncbi:MAG TPA: efflux RND transporter permease subunit [Caulobacteraceae bacterium]|nr:efflux RND transporter permease subunit [Caulobacteraceae bacterium]
MANLSAPFIRRPVATSLIAIGFLILGIVAYMGLPVAALPQVDFPTLQVSASLPGASPETMASNVATPLERQFAAIQGLTQVTSSSALGSTNVTLQFDLSRNIDSAEEDVLAAINAAGGQLPTNLPAPPSIRKVNPADAPILIISLRSDTLTLPQVNDYADNILSQHISQIEGVGQVYVGGQQKPAIRIRVDPAKIAALGLQLDTVRTMLASQTVNAPKGSINGPTQNLTIYANDQLTDPAIWNNLVVGYNRVNGGAVRVRDVGEAVSDVENDQIGAWLFPGKTGLEKNNPGGRALLLIVFKQPGANVIETVDRVEKALPGLRANIPPSIDVRVVADRTQTIRASVKDVEITLLITVFLVVGVIFLFLRNIRATLIPSVVIPLCLLATAAVMLPAHFSLDNLSLMALTIAVGFVVDDAIVMEEVIWQKIEHGMAPMEAALAGSGEISFTILTISISLIAVFTPLMFMGGVVGRLMREFALTLSSAVVLSIFMSLTVTPMLCSRFLQPPEPPRNGFTRALERGFNWIETSYARALDVVLRHMRVTLAVFFAAAVLAGILYATVPTGFFPQQDTGFLGGVVLTSQDASFTKLSSKVNQVADVIAADHGVENVAFYAGNGGSNQANISITLKPRDAGRKATATQIINRLRPKLAQLVGVQAFLQANQDINVGGRAGQAQYQYTLSSSDLTELNTWTPRMLQALQQIPQLKDVSSDQQLNAGAVKLTIDRDAAARFGISPADIDNAIYNLVGQREIGQYFTQLNAYHVVLEAPPSESSTPAILGKVFILSPITGKTVPLSMFVRVNTDVASSLTVPHQGQFPAATLSFNLAPGVSLGQATQLVQKAREDLGAPATLTGSFQGTAQAFQQSLASEPILIAAALLAVYVILGILYESYIHPLTILSTLPSAGVGAILALLLAGQDLNVIGIIAIILLIGIVKKNGIMIVDVALRLERDHGWTAVDAAREASHRRLRPILMTTAAAMLGGVPMILFHGTGSEFRQPLGYAIVGGLLVSQALTLFTTPVIYIYLDRLRGRMSRDTPHSGSTALVPYEEHPLAPLGGGEEPASS